MAVDMSLPTAHTSATLARAFRASTLITLQDADESGGRAVRCGADGCARGRNIAAQAAHNQRTNERTIDCDYYRSANADVES